MDHHSAQSLVRKVAVTTVEAVDVGIMHFVNQKVGFLTDEQAPSLQVAMP